MSRDAVTGVEKLLSPEALQEAGRQGTDPEQGVSRHTAYRLWGTDRSRTVIDVADFVVETNLESAAGLFSSVMEAHAKAVRDLELQGQPVASLDPGSEAARAGLRKVIRLIFEWQLESPVVPAGWALQGAALTSSPLWRGEPPDKAVQETGRRVLDARAAFYTAVTDRWMGVLESLLALWGRRPRDEATLGTLVQLMSALMDGFLLRTFVDPEVNDTNVAEARREELLQHTISLVSDTILDLVWTYTDQALVDDPRRPDPRRGADVKTFDRIVEAAAETYEHAAGPIDPADAAAKAGVPEPAASAYFADAGSLADSVLRRLVVPSGLDLSMSRVMNPTPLIELMLRRLKQTATTHPAAIQVAQSQPPSDSLALLSQLNQAVARALQSPKVNCPDPQETAYTLIELTLSGDSGWKAVEAILAVYGASTIGNGAPS